jgi:hypothetical protein
MTQEAIGLVCEPLEGAREALCDAANLPCTLDSVDTLGHLRLAAARLGCRLHVRNASPELRELITFAGLEEVLTPRGGAEARRAGRASRYPGRT